MQCSLSSCYLVPLRLKGIFSAPYLQTLLAYVPQLERPSVILLHKTGKIAVLYILSYMFLDSVLEDSPPNDSKHSLTSPC